MNTSPNTLKLALQKSGRLSDDSMRFLRKSGFTFSMTDRSLVAQCINFPLELLFLRTNDIPEILKDGIADIGICGQNTIKEKKFPLKELEKLGFGKCRLSISAPEKISLSGKKIATSYPNLLRKFLRSQNIYAEIVELAGSVEIAPNLGIADAICDLVSTGSTLQMNGLQELQTILESEAVLIARKDMSSAKKNILEKFLVRIRAMMEANRTKYILMNAPRSALSCIQKLIPGLESPTISPLSNPDWVSVASVVEEDVFWDTIEKLKKCGAEGILVLPIEKMIL